MSCLLLFTLFNVVMRHTHTHTHTHSNLFPCLPSLASFPIGDQPQDQTTVDTFHLAHVWIPLCLCSSPAACFVRAPAGIPDSHLVPVYTQRLLFIEVAIMCSYLPLLVLWVTIIVVVKFYIVSLL